MSQLSAKTNQFNLTTRRYSQAEIEAFVEGDAHEVFCFELRDKFGNNGIVGLAIIELCGPDPRIDSFLMSCRVISRTAEHAFMAVIIEYLRGAGHGRVHGEWVKTTRNSIVENLYEGLGFEVVKAEETKKEYALDLAEPTTIQNRFIRIKEGCWS